MSTTLLYQPEYHSKLFMLFYASCVNNISKYERTLKHYMFYTLQYNRSWLSVLQHIFGYITR